MRIGVFVELYRPHISGVVVSVEMLIRQISERGHEVILFAPEVPQYKDSPDFEVVRIPSFKFFNKSFAKPFLSRELKEKIESFKIDLIHIQGPYLTGILGIRLGRKLNLPVITTYHTNVIFYLKSWSNFWNWPLSLIARIISLFVIFWVSKRSQLIIVPSFFIKKVLRGYGIKNRIEVLPTGVQNPFFSQSDSLKDQIGLNKNFLFCSDLISENVKVLIYVGRIAKEKNLKILLFALEEVLKKRKDVVLVLLGDGPQVPELKKILAQKRMENRVLFLGNKPHGEIWSFLKASDVFVFPSLSETQGLSVSEAMAAGLPVVVVDEGGASEFIDDKKDGLIVRNNPKEFASAILSILEDLQFASFLGRNAQEKSLKLKPEIIYQKMESLYLEIAKDFNSAGK